MRALRIGLAVLGALLVLVVVAAIIAVRTFDPNAYKDELTDYVQQRTGRSLNIADDIELTLFPWLAIETGGLALSEAPRFGERDLVTIDRLSGRVRVWPLLRRRVEIGRVILEGVDLTLGFDAEGRGNWQDLLTGDTASDAGAAAESGAAVRLPAIERLAVEAIELRHARIAWHDFAMDTTRYVVSDLDLETSRIDDDAPVEFETAFALLDVASGTTAAIELSAVARAADHRVTVRQLAADVRLPQTLAGLEPLELTLSADTIEFDRATRALSVRELVTQVGDITAEWDLSASDRDAATMLDGSVSVRSPTLRALFDTGGLAWPAALDNGDGGAFTASTGFAFAPDPPAFMLDDTDVTALGVRITGAAVLADDHLSAEIAVPAFAPREQLLAWLEPQLPDGIELGGIAAAEASARLAHTLGSGHLAIDDVSITLDDARIGADLALTGFGPPERITGSVTASGLDNRLVAALFGPWLPADLLAADIGKFSLDTTFDHDPARDRTAFDPVALEAYGLAARGSLSIVDRNGDLIVAGRAEIDEFSPRALLGRFDLPVPESRDPSSLSSARLAAEFSTMGSSGDFREIVLELDDSTITGELGVENFADPSYHFDLRADRIDVDRYLPPRTDEAETTARTVGDIELRAAPLTATPVAGSAHIDELGIAGLRLQQVSTELVVGQGSGRLDSVQAQLYGGEFAGRLAVDAAAAGPGRTELAGSLRNVSLAPLLTALLGDSHISGTGSIELDLTGTGGTVDEVTRTAAGFMNVALVSGQIQGFNLERTLCAAFNAVDRSPAPPDAPDTTAFTEIRADATVADGIASTSNLLASTGSVAVTGTGGMRLSDRYLDFDMRAQLDDRIEIERCDRINSQVGNSFPFSLKGTLPNVIPVPDLARYLQDRARDELRDSIGDRIRDSILDRLR